jgi:hypothetical protein
MYYFWKKTQIYKYIVKKYTLYHSNLERPVSNKLFLKLWVSDEKELLHKYLSWMTLTYKWNKVILLLYMLRAILQMQRK